MEGKPTIPGLGPETSPIGPSSVERPSLAENPALSPTPEPASSWLNQPEATAFANPIPVETQPAAVLPPPEANPPVTAQASIKDLRGQSLEDLTDHFEQQFNREVA